jgi:hypothetical protein
MRTMIAILSLMVLASASFAQAEGQKLDGPKPSTKLNFEDGMVEGMNKRPLDAFHQLSEADKSGRLPHLYKKRANFADEIAETLKQVRYNQ